MRRLLSALTLLLIPAAALAAFTRPSDMLVALQLQGKPLDIAYEAHVAMDNTVYVSAWLTGAMEAKDADTAKADLKLTVDVTVPGEGNLRGRMLLRVIKKTLYMRLEELSGTFQNEFRDMAAEFVDKRWYAVTLDDVETLQELAGRGIIDESEVTIAVKRAMDAMLSLDVIPGAGDTTYSVKFKRNAAAELAKILPQMAEQYPSLDIQPMSKRDIAELRKMLSKVNLHIKGTFGRSDEPKSLKFYLAATVEEVRAVVQGTASLRTQPLRVLAPANAVPLEEALNSAE